MSSKSPYEIRLELIKEAKEILQARAANAAAMPSTEDVIEEAEKLNNFISTKPTSRPNY